MIVDSVSRDESRSGRLLECWLLHGNLGLPSDWRSTSAVLAANGIATRAVELWRFLCCDSLTLQQTARALNAEAKGHSPPKVLVAYSLGARIALHALLDDPSPWHAAVLVSAHPGLDQPDERSARVSRDTAWAAAALTQPWQQFIQAWNQQDILGGEFPRAEADQRRLLQRRQEIARGFVSWSLGRQQPLWDQLPSIRVPVLWLAGESDSRYLALSERACALNPRFRAIPIASAAHRCPWEAPQTFHSHLLEFLIETQPTCSATTKKGNFPISADS